MGLPGIHDNLDDFTVRFSDDVLKIELAGPDMHQFSVVDVPGIFHSEYFSILMRWHESGAGERERER